MSTPQRELLRAALRVVEAAAPRPVSIEELYAAVDREVELDRDDEVPPTHKGRPVADEACKRNLRNALQAEKRAHRLVNVEHGSWGLPQPNPALDLSLREAWPLVRKAAAEAIERGEVFTSPVQGKRYGVSGVDEAGLEIRRIDSGSTARVTRGEVERAVGFVNAAGGRAGRRTLHYTVAKEEAIVRLHPHLRWDESKEWVVARPDGFAPTTGVTSEAAPEEPRRYWALLANPMKYRVEEAVRALREDWWTTKGKALTAGDGVVIWKAGGRDGRRGVVALGAVVSEPKEVSTEDSPFWVDSAEGEKVEERVRVRYEVPDALPLWVGGEHDEALSALSVSRARGGTVFYVSEEEWEAVRAAAGVDLDRPLPPTVPELAEVVSEVVDETLISSASSGKGTALDGAGSGSPTRRSHRAKAVGDRAEAVVVQHLRRTLPPSQRGSVRWVASEGERPGWDVEYVDADGELVAVEVKGTTGEWFASVEVTANEWAAAEAKSEQFHLYLVARCTGERPLIEIVEDPAAAVRDGRFAATPSVWQLKATSEGADRL